MYKYNSTEHVQTEIDLHATSTTTTVATRKLQQQECNVIYSPANETVRSGFSTANQINFDLQLSDLQSVR